jgi:hypothetical protein
MKVKELIELLVADGWFQVRMNSALKQSGLKKEK